MLRGAEEVEPDLMRKHYSHWGSRRWLDSRIDEIEENAPSVLHVLESGFLDVTAIWALAEKYQRGFYITVMVERFIEEIRRREMVVRIFPNVESAQAGT